MGSRSALDESDGRHNTDLPAITAGTTGGEMAETKIHLKGYRCGTQGHRWSSSTISSNSNPTKVTCRKCLAEAVRRLRVKEK